MQIKFEMVDEKNINIIGIDETNDNKEHKIGHIFTPGGTSKQYKNSIQICGFTEAFDLWGCGVYGQPATKQIDDAEYKLDKNGNKYIEQVKDINLMFSIDTQPYIRDEWHKGCLKCYNDPCTCETYIRFENPYTVKRVQDLNLEKISNKQTTKHPTQTSAKVINKITKNEKN